MDSYLYVSGRAGHIKELQDAYEDRNVCYRLINDLQDTLLKR